MGAVAYSVTWFARASEWNKFTVLMPLFYGINRPKHHASKRKGTACGAPTAQIQENISPPIVSDDF
jgi:hypothetical protein